MKRVIVIGCPGAGKSTFARELSAKTGLPLWHLDMIWHRPDKTTLDRATFVARLEKIIAEEKWIIDGNYLHTIALRLDHCDTVFFFDIPVDICIAGAESRVGKKREDMPWTESELDREFRQWIIDFPATRAPVIHDLLRKYEHKTNIIVFHTRQAATAFFNSL